MSGSHEQPHTARVERNNNRSHNCADVTNALAPISPTAQHRPPYPSPILTPAERGLRSTHIGERNWGDAVRPAGKGRRPPTNSPSARLTTERRVDAQMLSFFFPPSKTGRVRLLAATAKEMIASRVRLYKESRRGVAYHPPTSRDNRLIPKGARMPLDEVRFDRCPSIIVLCNGLSWREDCAVRVPNLL